MFVCVCVRVNVCVFVCLCVCIRASVGTGDHMTSLSWSDVVGQHNLQTSLPPEDGGGEEGGSNGLGMRGRKGRNSQSSGAVGATTSVRERARHATESRKPTILGEPQARVEIIVSCGRTSPSGFPYMIAEKIPEFDTPSAKGYMFKAHTL